METLHEPGLGTTSTSSAEHLSKAAFSDAVERVPTPNWFTIPVPVLYSLLLVVSLGVTLASAQTNDADRISLWDKSFTLRAGAGYKDNVTLSQAATQESPFITSGFDAMVFRLPIDGPEFYLFLTGDDYRYFGSGDVDKEQTFIATSRVRKEFGSGWEAGFGLQYFYQNQVFDVSATELDLTTVQIQGHSIKGTPTVGRKLSDQYKLQLELPVNRQILRAPLDNYWESGPKLTLERQYGRRSSWNASYGFERRFYDHREKTDGVGFPLAGTSLEFDQHDFEFGNRHFWDEKRRWRTDTKLGFEINVDNGSGFFDYYRYQISQQLRYTAPTWMIRGTVRTSYYDYSVQMVALDNADKRYLANLELTLRGEKNLSKRWKWFTEYNREDAFSNRGSNEYSADVITTGLEVEF